MVNGNDVTTVFISTLKGYSDYNLEFQGSVWKLQKRALFRSFTQKCFKITQKCLKLTVLLAKGLFFVKYYKGQCPTTWRWFVLDYSLIFFIIPTARRLSLRFNLVGEISKNLSLPLHPPLKAWRDMLQGGYIEGQCLSRVLYKTGVKM